MAVDKNIQIKKWNGTDFDSLFPKSKATLVTLTDGTTVQSAIDTLKAGDGTTSVTQADIDLAITNLKNGVGTNLDTLKEIATSINNDANFNGTMTTALGLKVDKIAGKGLSTNDFTTALQTKLNATEQITYGTVAPTSGIWYQEV